MVVIEMENGGIIELELDHTAAPITAKNFEKLVSEGFYDGLIFHRVIPGFMIQGGDPLGNGMGGAKERIRGEFRANGVNNPIKHTRGTVSMARAQDPDSASSQFFHNARRRAVPRRTVCRFRSSRIRNGYSRRDSRCPDRLLRQTAR